MHDNHKNKSAILSILFVAMVMLIFSGKSHGQSDEITGENEDGSRKAVSVIIPVQKKDLFKPECQEKVNELVVEYLINVSELYDGSWFRSIPLHNYTDDAQYSFDKKNLYILYGMYQVGCAAMGEPILSIPLLKLSDCINLDGPLAHVLSHCDCTKGN